MHIVHVGANYRIHTTNGVNRAVTQYARYQRLLGHEVTMVSFAAEGTEIADEVTSEGIHLVRLPRPRIPFLLSRTAKALFESDALKGDIYHFHSSFNPTHNQVARLLAKPYVVSPHGAYSPQSLRRSRLRKQVYRVALDRTYLRGAGAIHAVTEAERSQVVAYCGVRNIEVIPNPVESVAIPTQHERRISREALGIHPSDFVVLYIGRLDVEHKGLDLLIEGARACREQGPVPHLRLVIAGPQDRRRSIESLLTERDKQWVIVRPPVFGDQKRVLYAAADLFATISRWDGLPTAVLEAASHGLPVLVTEASGLADFVHKFGAGSTVPPAAKAVADQLMKEANNPCTEERRQRVAYAVREAFDPSVTASRLLKLYEQVRAEHARCSGNLMLTPQGY